MLAGLVRLLQSHLYFVLLFFKNIQQKFQKNNLPQICQDGVNNLVK